MKAAPKPPPRYSPEDLQAALAYQSMVTEAAANAPPERRLMIVRERCRNAQGVAVGIAKARAQASAAGIDFAATDVPQMVAWAVAEWEAGRAHWMTGLVDMARHLTAAPWIRLRNAWVAAGRRESFSQPAAPAVNEVDFDSLFGGRR